MGRGDTRICMGFVDVARGKSDRIPGMSKGRTNHVLEELSWAVARVLQKRCPVCGREFKSMFVLKSHMARAACGRVLVDEIERSSRSYRGGKGRPRADGGGCGLGRRGGADEV